MIKLGITGNIASGKTLVESFMQQEGIPTIDADVIVHNLLKNDKDTIQQVSDVFIKSGIDVKDENNGISRKKVGEVVFRDEAKLRALENILHPKVKNKILEFFRTNQDKNIAAAIVPLIFEAGMEDMFDYIVLVIADKKVRMERLVNKRNITEEQALERMDAQMSQEEKLVKADFIIDNNNGAEYTKKQIKELLSAVNNLL